MTTTTPLTTAPRARCRPLLAAALCAATLAAHAAAPCPGADEATQRDLIGRWQATFAGDHAPRALRLWQHPELADSVRGEAERDNGATPGAETAPVLVAGDVDHGEFTLEESSNGINISATWSGRVADGSCGKEIRGTWNNAANDRSTAFVLRKQPEAP